MQNLIPVELPLVYRLLNVGGTCLVSAAHEGQEDVMPAAWNTALDIDPGLLTVVVDKSHYTRRLMDESRLFGIALPTVSIAREVMALGSVSKNDDPAKLEKSGAEFFKFEGWDMPFVKGCAGYIVCRARDEQDIEKRYDLFVGEALAAWADPRIFDGRHWLYEKAPKDLSTLHYVAGGRFYGIGQTIDI